MLFLHRYRRSPPLFGLDAKDSRRAWINNSHIFRFETHSEFTPTHGFTPTFGAGTESNPDVPRRCPTHILLLLLLGISAGCQKDKTLTDEDLRSGLKSISSVASETKLFITQIRQQRVTRTFAGEHLKYLRDQNEETLHDLTQASETSAPSFSFSSSSQPSPRFRS